MENSEKYFHKKIIVIGAGIAGLACASCLRDYGFENILVLEAKDRIGGRTHTVIYKINEVSEETENDYIEFGAEWIHGVEGNAIYELAHSKGLVNESAANYHEALTNYKLLFTNEESDIIKNLIEYLDEKLENVQDMDEDIRLSDFLDKAFVEYLEKYSDLAMVEFLKGIFDWYNKLLCELNGCTNLSSVSTFLLNQYKECEGSQTVQLKFGFSSILSLMYQKIPNDRILMNHEVEKIDWTEFKTDEYKRENEKSELALNCKDNLNQEIKLFCKNGKVYEANHVIITIPLGSLKEKFSTLFIPALSENKIKAIQSVGFGTVNKIFLEFCDPFWESPAVYHVMWNKSLDELFQGSNESSKVWLKCINRFSYSPSHRNMLCVWVVGEGAIIMENLSSEEVSSNCMELLEMLVGKELPKPNRIFRSKWHSDPHTQGSYSYLSMESNKESNLQIANPEISNVLCSQHPVLQFAGEATHPFHFSTVHGAYETGIREAQRLFEHYRYS